MKFSIKPALIAACISCTLAVPQLAIAGEKGKSQRPNPFSALSLTEEQEVELKNIAPLPMAHKRKKNGLRNLAPVIFSDELNTEKLALFIDASIAKRKARGLHAAEKRFAIHQILSDEQVVELQANREAKKNDKPSKPSLEQKLTDKLELTDAQVSAMQPYFSALSSIKAEGKLEREAFKTFEQSLFTQGTFNSDAWLTQFDAMSENMKLNQQAFATNMHNIYGLLDEAQQKKIRHQVMKKKRKQKRS